MDRTEPMTRSTHCPAFLPPSYEYVCGAQADASGELATSPPPPYETPPLEGLPQYPGHINGQPFRCPRLVYADFLPCRISAPDRMQQPVYENFRSLMLIVNDWLQNNPQYQVLNCENIERKVCPTSGVAETETTVSHQSAFGITAYVRGIRLWLVANTQNAAVQQLWYTNVMPEIIPMTSDVQTFFRTNPVGRYLARTALTPLHRERMRLSFENLDTVLAKLNTLLSDKPLPGRILTVEHLTLTCDDFDSDLTDPDESYWSEKGSLNHYYLKTLRIFFVVGPPMPQQIGIKDFVPACSNKPIGRPQFESHSILIDRANRWIGNQTAPCRILNWSTVNANVNLTNLQDEVIVNSRQMHYAAGAREAIYVSVLRVAYVDVPGPKLERLTCCTFVPRRLERKLAESTSQTVAHMNAWLNYTGAKVLCASTARYEFCPEASKAVQPDKCSYHVCSTRGHYWITVIRLYLDGEYTDAPLLDMFTPPPAYTEQRQKDSLCCSLQ